MTLKTVLPSTVATSMRSIWPVILIGSPSMSMVKVLSVESGSARSSPRRSGPKRNSKWVGVMAGAEFFAGAVVFRLVLEMAVRPFEDLAVVEFVERGIDAFATRSEFAVVGHLLKVSEEGGGFFVGRAERALLAKG